MTLLNDFTERAERAAELVAGLDSQDVYHVLRALEQRFEMRVSTIDRTEIGELFVLNDLELTDDRWEAFRSTEAWEDWNVDTWQLWKEAIGHDAVLEVAKAQPADPLVYDPTGPIPFPKR